MISYHIHIICAHILAYRKQTAVEKKRGLVLKNGERIGMHRQVGDRSSTIQPIAMVAAAVAVATATATGEGGGGYQAKNAARTGDHRAQKTKNKKDGQRKGAERQAPCATVSHRIKHHRNTRTLDVLDCT